MTDNLSFLFGTKGRATRKAMILVTTSFLAVGFLRAQFLASGVMAVGMALLVVQLVLIWPAHIAVPIRRLHDMGRQGGWIALFWGGAFLGALFMHWGIGQTAPIFDMSAADVWMAPSTYVEKVAAFNAGRPETEQITAMNATAMGGFSLAMIFLIVQFGWLHLVPGTGQDDAIISKPHSR